MNLICECLKMSIGTIKRIPLFISTMIPKQENLYIFGAWFGQKYSDNSKALFETALQDASIKSIWITKNFEIYNLLKNQNLPVEMSTSLRGIWLQCRAKVAITCTGKNDFNSKLLGNAYHIELWHGVGGGKTVGFDDATYRSQMDNIRGRYYRKIEAIPYRHSYFVCTSDEMKRIFLGAFRLPESHYLMAGQPRNDMFYDINYQIKTLDVSELMGRKVIAYLPTHRKNGDEKIDCSKLFDFEQLNTFCKNNNCIFLIKKHFYHKDEIEQISKFEYILDWSNRISVDTNELLMVIDYLITDYSSVATDFLLMKKPVFYYCYDYDEYILNDRTMYWNYDQISPGPKVKNFEQLIESLKLVICEDKDEYKSQRNTILNMFYGEQARKMVGNDILKYIKNIIKR